MTDQSAVIPPRRKLKEKPSTTADRLFYGVSSAAAYSTIVLVVAIIFFLTLRAWPAFEQQGLINFVFGSGWDASQETPIFRIGPMLYGSFLVAAIGVFLAVPMAIS